MEIKRIKLPFVVKKTVLALGAQAKNTVCFAGGDSAFLSGVHADLSRPKDFLAFTKDVKYFLKHRPKIIAFDLHPEYSSTKYANQLTAYSLQLTAVQHHHAHIASCMAENGLKNQKVIGVAFDGTGLGTDGRLWGAEFFLCDYKDFKRAAHLKEIPLVGGERAILEPWRLVEAWFDFKHTAKGGRLKKIYQAGVNSPFSSSMGRLFDVVASLVLAKCKANFEAELAIELERLATCYPSTALGASELRATSHKFKIIKNNGEYIIDPLPMLKEIVVDLKKNVAREKIAYRFHLTVAEMIKKTCLILKKIRKTNTVVLSGGVFQNKLLLRLALDLLYQEKFKVLTHRDLSSNDSGISLGQAVIAG